MGAAATLAGQSEQATPGRAAPGPGEQVQQGRDASMSDSDDLGYCPVPIATNGVELRADLLALAERLAENAHDNWACQRLADGWRYGPCRDDATKEHPCLVPYDALPESEKEYDRRTALETLR